MSHLYRLIRLPNLLVIALTQHFLFTRVIFPIFREAGLNPILSQTTILGLMSATCLAAAAGYIINDIMDQPIDADNEDYDHLVGSGISERTAYWLFFCCTVGGFLMSLWLAMSLGGLNWLWLFPLVGLFLAFYSSWIKPLPLAGNLLVSILCAAVAGIVLLAERQNLGILAQAHPVLSGAVWRISGLFMAYAFGATFIREIIKDLEDIRGDARNNRRTVPISWGIRNAKILLSVLIVLLLVLLSWPLLMDWAEFSGKIALFYHVFLLLNFSLLIWMIWVASRKIDYHRISQVVKWLMAAGIGLLYVLGSS